MPTCPPSGQNYRVFRFPWAGKPTVPPAFKAYRQDAGAARFYASWNGATELAAWRLETGREPGRFARAAPIRSEGSRRRSRSRRAPATRRPSRSTRRESRSAAPGRSACTRSSAGPARAGSGARPVRSQSPSRQMYVCTRERALVRLVDEQAAGLPAPVGPRLAEPGRGCDGRAALTLRPDLELVPLGDRALVGVPGDDQLRARVDERCRARGRGARPAACASATARRSAGGAARRCAARPAARRRAARPPSRAGRRGRRRTGGATAAPS